MAQTTQGRDTAFMGLVYWQEAGMRVVLDRQARAHLAADGVTRARLDALVGQGRVTLVAEQGDDLAEQAAVMADALVAGAWRTRARAERLSERLTVLRPHEFGALLALD